MTGTEKLNLITTALAEEKAGKNRPEMIEWLEGEAQKALDAVTLKPTGHKGEWKTQDGRFTVVVTTFAPCGGVQVWDRDNPAEIMGHGTYNAMVDNLEDARSWIANA